MKILKFDTAQIEDLVVKARQKVEADFDQRLIAVAGQIKQQSGGDIGSIYSALRAVLASGALYILAEDDYLLAVVSVRLEGHRAVLSFRQLARQTQVLDLSELVDGLLLSVAKVSAQAVDSGEMLVLENAGFRRVAVLRDEVLIDGNLRDTVLYERLSRERQEPEQEAPKPIEEEEEAEEVFTPVVEETAEEEPKEAPKPKRERLRDEFAGVVSENIQITKGE